MGSYSKVLYQVVSHRAVCVEDDGNAFNYQAGAQFYASPSNPDVVRLLRLNYIRVVSKQELGQN